jgi:hypothetical protein
VGHRQARALQQSAVDTVVLDANLERVGREGGFQNAASAIARRGLRSPARGDETSREPAINILRCLPRWPGLEAALGEDQGDRGAGPMAFRAWQMRGRRIVGDRSRPTPVITFVQVSRTMPTMTVNTR